MDVGFRRAADDVEGCHFVDGNLQQVRNRGTIASVLHPRGWYDADQADHRRPAVLREIQVERAPKTALPYRTKTSSISNMRIELEMQLLPQRADRSDREFLDLPPHTGQGISAST